MVEKHGKGPDDSEIFARVRMWLREYLLKENAFIDTEEKLVEVLRSAADKEWKANKAGLKFQIEVFHPGPRPTEKHELLFDDHVTRSYCWESLPRPGADKVILRNWLFSDARNFTAVPYQVQRVAVEAGDWRKGFWSDCSWRKGPLELGSDNEITRKHSVQCTDSTAVTSVSLPNLDFASICARDERRLEKACRRKRRKRQQSTSSS